MGKKDTLKNSNVHYKEDSTPITLHAHTITARNYFKGQFTSPHISFQRAYVKVRSHFIGLPLNATIVK